ncbi:MAG: cobalamin-binding protein [Gemmatimonadaceae bacterium]
MRIVSLLPAATEIVCALGLEDQLVGVTHECDYPATVRGLPRVTRSLISVAASSGEIDRVVRERVQAQQALYTLDLPLLQALRPDLIVTQALCDVCAVAEDEVQAVACALPGAPRVLDLAPQTIHEVFDGVRQVARATGMERHGDDVVQALTARVDAVARRSAFVRARPRVAFLEWLDPPFSSGHWTPELIRLAGGIEGLGHEGKKSRTLRWEEVIAWHPEVVVIACCGFDVERTLGELAVVRSLDGWDALPAVRDERVYVMDGSQYFSRPGPRLVDSLELLAYALHPDLHPLPSNLLQPVRLKRAVAPVYHAAD